MKSSSQVTEEPLVTICVLNYNGFYYIRRFFESLSEIKCKNCELIIVDNCSTDGSLNLIKEQTSKLRINSITIIESKKNLGYAGGHNLGAASAKGKYFFFLNIDVVVEEDFLDCVHYMEENENVSICQPLIMNYDTEIIQNMGTTMSYLGHLKILKKDIPLSAVSVDMKFNYRIFSVLGAAFCVRSILFKKLGGFDSDFFMYFEESDLCWRAIIRGYEVQFYHDPSKRSKVFHKAYGTITKTDNVNHLFIRNRFLSMLKNYQLRSIPFALISLAISLLGSKSFRISIRSVSEVILLLPSVIRKRNGNKYLRIKNDKDIITGIW